jgi:hypothetical protein
MLSALCSPGWPWRRVRLPAWLARTKVLALSSTLMGSFALPEDAIQPGFERLFTF